MDFNWTPEQTKFRNRIKNILAEQLPRDWARLTGYDTGGDYIVEFSRTFCPLLAKEQLLIPHWPVEYGGGGADAWLHWILNEEMWAAGEPRSYQYMSVNWVGPAIIKFGSAEQRSFHLSRITSGTIYYCQGFSEPDAGSDLAALKTRAEHNDGGYRINGSKVWTSAAGFADFCILLARTGGPGRDGISVFIVPMDTPGIEVRRIPSLQGYQSLNEVFFTDVEVPSSAMLGEENEGWKIITQILHNERIGAPRYSLTRKGLRRAVHLLKERGKFDQVARVRAAQCEIAIDSAMLQAYKVIDGRVKGMAAGPETNLARYAGVLADRTVCDFLGDFLPDAIHPDVDPVVAGAYKRTAAIGIAAGAAEIQLNLISRHLLEMPSK
jgi:alkylation response protein AidB-like acyl-CoA dehydrogenase